MARSQSRVVPGADRRSAEEAGCARLRAQAAEERAVPRDDVVRVQAVEAGRLRPSDEWRMAEDAHILERSKRISPLGGRIAVSVVDVEVGDIALLVEPGDVFGRTCRCPSPVRLDVDGEVQPLLRGCLLDERQTLVLG